MSSNGKTCVANLCSSAQLPSKAGKSWLMIKHNLIHGQIKFHCNIGEANYPFI